MIEIKNLTKRFQDFTALENVTCTIGSPTGNFFDKL